MSPSSPNQPESLSNPLDGDAATVLTKLKEIASNEGVPDVAVWCLKCLQHPNAEIREWAAEALAESVQPVTAEAGGLIQWTRDRIDSLSSSSAEPAGQATGAATQAGNAALLTDQLYWGVKVLGRLDSADADTRGAAREAVDQISLLSVPDDDSAMQAVIERARRTAARLA